VAEQPDIIEQGHGRLSRALPSPAWALPRRVVIAMVAGIAAVVLAAGSVVAVLRPWAGGAGLPSPCSFLPAATVANLVPAVTGNAQALVTSRTTTTQMCTWRTASGTLLSLDVEYTSSKGLARQEFSALPDAVGPALAAEVRPVPGIGDQAQAVLSTGFPDEAAVYVRVLSGSALFSIGYNSARTGLRPLPADETILAKLVQASRAVFSHLTRTARVPAR
jgi:hypothetical protein